MELFQKRPEYKQLIWCAYFQSLFLMLFGNLWIRVSRAWHSCDARWRCDMMTLEQLIVCEPRQFYRSWTFLRLYLFRSKREEEEDLRTFPWSTNVDPWIPTLRIEVNARQRAISELQNHKHSWPFEAWLPHENLSVPSGQTGKDFTHLDFEGASTRTREPSRVEEPQAREMWQDQIQTSESEESWSEIHLISWIICMFSSGTLKSTLDGFQLERQQLLLDSASPSIHRRW